MIELARIPLCVPSNLTKAVDSDLASGGLIVKSQVLAWFPKKSILLVVLIQLQLETSLYNLSYPSLKH